MLTKNLLRYRKSKDSIIPKFINPDNPILLELANQLIDYFKQGINHHSAKSLQEVMTPLIYSQKDILFPKGLIKLLMDRAKFCVDSDLDYLEARRKVFTLSNVLIKKYPDLEHFQKEMKKKIDIDFKPLEGLDKTFYEDLSEHSILKEFKAISSEELLQLYNLSLVQSLLIYCDRIEIIIEDEDSGKYRNLFRAMKFHQLLGTPAEIDDVFKLIVDGPMSILENSKKYGIKIALFFPHLCEMKKWSLKTQILLNRHPLTLTIDESAGLKNFYRRTHFIPEELDIFRKRFKHPDWKLIPLSKWIHLRKQYFILPDFTIENNRGRQYHIELFHRWHASPLLERLETLEKEKVNNFILGVDRSLSKKPQVRKFLDDSLWFKKYGFLFRDIPVPAQVIKVLDSF